MASAVPYAIDPTRWPATPPPRHRRDAYLTHRYYLDPEDYGEPEVTEICIGTSWNYLGGLFRKSKVDEDAPPAADLSYPAGSAPACREVSLVLNLATNADGVEDPQPIFDYAATGACAAVDE